MGLSCQITGGTGVTLRSLAPSIEIGSLKNGSKWGEKTKMNAKLRSQVALWLQCMSRFLAGVKISPSLSIFFCLLSIIRHQFLE